MKGTKRYNLVLPDDLFTDVQVIANAEGVPTVEIFRRFIKLGLILTGINRDEGERLILRSSEGEREIMWV